MARTEYEPHSKKYFLELSARLESYAKRYKEVADKLTDEQMLICPYRKTTQVDLLRRFLEDHNQACVTSKEPTDGPWGKKIRATASTGRLPLAEELQLFVNDRKEHIKTLINPALQAGKIVILDRYFYSTIA